MKEWNVYEVYLILMAKSSSGMLVIALLDSMSSLPTCQSLVHQMHGVEILLSHST
jgi:hypothetical protein